MLTKRQLLQYVGSVAGAAGVYRTMAALGMLGVSSLTGCSSPASSQGPGYGKRVVILGTGIAGLTAAYELAKAEFSCTILEATSRTGGRNLTVRAGDMIEEMNNPSQRVEFDDEDYLYANMGPARIPYHHRTMLDYCKRFDVELEVFTNDNRAAFFHGNTSFGGRRVVARQWHTDQRGYIAELLAKAVNAGHLDSELTGDDKENFLTMLRNFGDLDGDHMYNGSGRAGYRGPHVNKGLGLGMDKEPVQPFSLNEILGLDFDAHPAVRFYPTYFAHTIDQNPTLFQPVGGMDRIVEAFKNEVLALGVDIHYDSVVEEIKNATDGGGGVTISYFDNWYNSPGLLEADYAICTIPAPVLVNISNNFADETRNAIRNTPFSKAFKLAFQAPRRFWEDDDHIYGGISWTSFDGVTQIWYPANGYHRRKGVMLGAYIFGEPGFGLEAAERFAGMTPRQRLDEAIVHGEKIHRGYREMLTENGRLNGVSVPWSEMRYQQGGWPYALGGLKAMNELRDSVTGVVRDGDVYFAGDQVSELPGWQEGAALSAINAVQAIRARA